MLYGLEDVTVSRGNTVILSHVNFKIQGTEKIALVGKNGAGKSTLLSVLSGELSVDRDDKRKSPALICARQLRVGMLHQTVFEDGTKRLFDVLKSGYHAVSVCVEADGYEKNLLRESDGLTKDEVEFLVRCDRLLTGFGFSLSDKEREIGSFSGGQQTKIGLMLELLKQPDVLLLDEPTNHLDLEAVEWLEQYLKEYPKAVVVISHDRYFLDQVAEVVYEVEEKSLKRYVGNYSDYVRTKAKEYDRQFKEWEHYSKEKERLEETIKRFKGKPTKASMARAKLKQLERMEVKAHPGTRRRLFLKEDLTPAILGPKCIYEAEHLKVGYDQVLLEAGIRIRRGQKIALLGANGSGKTALLKTITGLLPAIAGKQMLGNQVLIGYFDQMSADLDLTEKVFDHLRGYFPNLLDKELYRELAKWGFDGSQAMQQINTLSGGEKAKLCFMKLFWERPNFLVLDEPTNHMDIEARELLESAFEQYSGTMLFVSHDRYFINRIADALLILQEGELYYYPTRYESYLHRKYQTMESVPIGSMKAEDLARIEALRAVPKADRHQLKEDTTEKVYHDWQMRLANEALDQAEQQYIDRMMNMTCVADWEEAEERYLQAILTWYDHYQELHEE